MKRMFCLMSWFLLAMFSPILRPAALASDLFSGVEMTEISSGQVLSDSVEMVSLTSGTYLSDQNVDCEGDPLALSWLQTLISSLALNYCDSCLTITKAQWDNIGVIEVNWDAGNCGFTDLGFWTVYSCEGDTLQHCETTIAGLRCTPDSMIVVPEDLTQRDTIWQCNIPTCDIENDSILCQQWLIDTLISHFELCEVFCIEGNAGNFVYRHDFNGRTLIEFRTTCGTIERYFYNCSGQLVFECRTFDFGLMELCDTLTTPSLISGELLWDCSQPIKGSTSILDRGEMAVDVFPTIFDQVLNLRSSREVAELVVTNVRGRPIARIEHLIDGMTLNTSEWPSGSYFLTFYGEGKKVIKHVIKIK